MLIVIRNYIPLSCKQRLKNTLAWPTKRLRSNRGLVKLGQKQKKRPISVFAPGFHVDLADSALARAPPRPDLGIRGSHFLHSLLACNGNETLTPMRAFSSSLSLLFLPFRESMLALALTREVGGHAILHSVALYVPIFLNQSSKSRPKPLKLVHDPQQNT